MQENAKNAKLLALFNALEEDEKDIVLTMTKTLVDKNKDNMTEIVKNNDDKIETREHRIV